MTGPRMVAGKRVGGERAGGGAAGSEISDWTGLAGAPTDRRDARGHRSRNLIMDAAIELIQNGNPARRATRSPNRPACRSAPSSTISDHVEIVIRNATARQFHRHRRLIAFLPPNGPTDVRVQATCRQRRQLYEAIAPMLRVAYAGPTHPRASTPSSSRSDHCCAGRWR